MHRWLGRVYLATAGIAGFGGLGFIFSKGTIGGVPMNIGFGLYGALIVIASVETYRHGRAGRLVRHRVWGIRLFAPAIGSLRTPLRNEAAGVVARNAVHHSARDASTVRLTVGEALTHPAKDARGLVACP